jgi:hypothetical protein
VLPGMWGPEPAEGDPVTPRCVLCGHYLMPCTETANGIHPEIVNEPRFDSRRDGVPYREWDYL